MALSGVCTVWQWTVAGVSKGISDINFREEMSTERQLVDYVYDGSPESNWPF